MTGFPVAPKAARTSVEGIVFDSASELRRWEELRLLERAGKIRNLSRQVRFPLTLPNGKSIKIRSPGIPDGRRCFYTADFTYDDHTESAAGIYTVNEHKGVWSEAARLRLGVFEALYDTRVVITGEAKMRRRKRKSP